MAPDGETRARRSVGPAELPGAQEDIDADRTGEAVGGLFLGGPASRPKASIVAGNDGAAVRLFDRTGEPAATLMVEDLQRDAGDVIATLSLTPGGILPAEESGMPIDPKRLALTLSADGNGAGSVRLDGLVKTGDEPIAWPLMEWSLAPEHAALGLRTATAIFQRILTPDLVAFEGRRSAARYGSDIGS